MEILFLILILVLWYVIGVASFIYWWTKDHNLTLSDALFSLLIGIGGVGTFLAGFFIHSDSSEKTEAKILIPKRKKIQKKLDSPY